jgi:hypothetical protein
MEGRAWLVIGLIVVAVAGSLSAVVDVEAQAPRPPNRFIYPVKFLCGSILGEKVNIPDQGGAFEPNMGTPATEPPAKPGNYATAINIYNFQRTAVEFTKTSVIANPQGQPRGRVSTTIAEVLQPGQALEVDCPNIDAMFAPTIPTNGGNLPRFAKGFVTLESPVELQVVGVYTAEKMEIAHKGTCDPAPIVVNTGWSGQTTTGPVIPPGATDDDWRVVNAPPSWTATHPPLPYFAPVVSGVSTPPPTPIPWGPSITGTAWISLLPGPGFGGPLPTPPSVFEFEFRFSLDPGCTKAVLVMQLRADDIVGACGTPCASTITPGVSLNGVPVDTLGATFTHDPVETIQGLAGSTGGIFINQPLGVTLVGPITIAGPFHPGSNSLTVRVTDTAQGATGLDVAGSVTPAGGSTSVGAGVGLSIDVEYISAKRRLQ